MTVDFSDCKSSPDLSCLGESLVQFVAKTPGPDWEDNPLTIIIESQHGVTARKVRQAKEEEDIHGYFTLTHHYLASNTAVMLQEGGYMRNFS